MIKAHARLHGLGAQCHFADEEEPDVRAVKVGLANTFTLYSISSFFGLHCFVTASVA